MLHKSQRDLRGPRERGMALILVMAIMATLLLGTGITTFMRMVDLWGSGQSLSGKRSYYCAEAGLRAGAVFFRANFASWPIYLANGFVLTGQAAPTGQIGLTYAVTISDNRDEMAPQPNDPLTDRDQTVLMQSTCTDATKSPVTLRQFLTMNPIDPNAVGLPARTGSYTYTTTSDFTATLGTDPTGGLLPGAAPQVLATGVDLRGDQIALQPGQMAGKWTVRQYCGDACNSWRSVSWSALVPPGTSVTVRARSAFAMTGLGGATWVTVASGAPFPPVGAFSLRGRIIEVEVTLASTGAATPVLQDLTINPWPT